MQLSRLLIVSACLTSFAMPARACPDHAARAATLSQPRTASAAALVAWRPRAWTPASRTPGLGVQVAIDPVDGTLGMPSAGELSASAGVGEEDLRPVSMIRRANGSGRAQLDERWESHAMATMGPDGKPRWTCVDGLVGAERFLKNPAIPAAAPVRTAPVWEEK